LLITQSVVEMQRLFYICEPELDWSDMWPIHTKKLVSLRVGRRVDSSCAIGATSVGTGGDYPTCRFKVGGPTMYCHPTS